MRFNRRGLHAQSASPPCLDLNLIPDSLERVGDFKGRKLTQLAVKLALLLFIRSSELRFARWDEIDLHNAMWTIPAEREPIPGVKYSTRGAKMRSPHLVPLSHQAIELLAAQDEAASGSRLRDMVEIKLRMVLQWYHEQASLTVFTR
ncbi:hypothetical protein FHC47_27560 [Klebsiella quasipneumoniae]|nr:hypothetical protein FHC47_27560 [Klebsiella quasipneumoniae]